MNTTRYIVKQQAPLNLFTSVRHYFDIGPRPPHPSGPRCPTLDPTNHTPPPLLPSPPHPPKQQESPRTATRTTPFPHLDLAPRFCLAALEDAEE